ncbi:MAG: 50S ribosomal protein L18 [Planctomycetota bacterium]|nr:50S ribosomal protein L18 [Planctomycetota bacterium]
MDKNKFLQQQRERRRFRVRKKLRGDGEMPRMCIYRSNKHIGCQLIDDVAKTTLVSVSTRDKDLRESVSNGGNKDAAQAIGKTIAERALAAGIKTVRLDRGSSKYHGRIAALADAAREAGLTL